MKKILFLSLVDWYWTKQRPQHFAEILSKNYMVTYICVKDLLMDRSLRGHEYNDSNLSKSSFYINQNLKVIRISLLPKYKKYQTMVKVNQWIYRLVLAHLDKKVNFDFIYITHPNQYSKIPAKLRNKVMIYDCMDNYLEFGVVNKDIFLRHENAILDQCRHIIVSSKALYQMLIERKNGIKGKVTIINNGVDLERFRLEHIIKEEEDTIIRRNAQVKVGYIGTVSNWVDMDLIKKTALRHKDYDFYLIGPLDNNINLPDIDNLIITGTQPYYTIPKILSHLDVAIMPFQKNELVLSVNPVKIYEYLSLGKPVVALKYEETEAFGDLIYTYETDNEFDEKIQAACQEDKSKYESRIVFAKQNSWVSRVNDLAEILDMYA